MERAPSKPRRWLMASIILVTAVGCDQTTKRIATVHLRQQPRKAYLADFVRLEYAQNSGAFLSLGSEWSPTVRFGLFTAMNLVFLAVLAGYLASAWRMQATRFVALAMILAGGSGNLIDRVIQRGLVTDFVNLGVGSLRTGIFNVADVSITFGALLLVISWRANRQSRGQERQADALRQAPV